MYVKKFIFIKFAGLEAYSQQFHYQINFFTGIFRHHVQRICYFGKSFLMSNAFFFVCLLVFLFFFVFSSLMPSVSDVQCICYLMVSCEYVILLGLLSLINAGRFFEVIFKRICNDLFQADIGLLLFDSEKTVVLPCVLLYFDNNISKMKVGNLQRIEKFFGKYN